MTQPRPPHHSRLLASPWPGVHGVVLDSARRFARHSHDTWGIGVLDHGAHRSASGRGPVDAYAGDVLTCNPGEVHDGAPLGGPSQRWRMVHLSTQAWRDGHEVDGPDCEFVFQRPVLHDPALRTALSDFLDWLALHACHSPTDATLLHGESLLTLVCHRMAPSASTPHSRRAEDPAVSTWASVREQLADLSAPAPTLASLAASAGLSKFQLLRGFTRAHGLPPHMWRLQRRVERARHLIHVGHCLADAAGAAGFADQSHMTRVFTRQFGYTPGDWQRAAAPKRMVLRAATSALQ